MSGSQRCAPPLTLSMRPRLFDGQDRSPLRPHSCKMAEARCGQQTADGGQRRCWNATDGMREEGGSRFTVSHLNRRWCTAKANTSDLLPRGNVSLKNSSRQRAGFCSIHLKKKIRLNKWKHFWSPEEKIIQYTNITLVRDARGIHLKWWIFQHNEEPAEPRVCCQCVGGVNRWSLQERWRWEQSVPPECDGSGCCHRSRVSTSLPGCSLPVCVEHLAVYWPVCTHSTFPLDCPCAHS